MQFKGETDVTAMLMQKRGADMGGRILTRFAGSEGSQVPRMRSERPDTSKGRRGLEAVGSAGPPGVAPSSSERFSFLLVQTCCARGRGLRTATRMLLPGRKWPTSASSQPGTSIQERS